MALLLLLIFGGIAGYLYNKFSTLSAAGFSAPPITIAAANAQDSVWPSTLEAVGTIRAARGVELSAETGGEVIEVAGDLFETPPDTLEGVARELIVGAYKLEERLLLVLDVDKAVNLEQLGSTADPDQSA